MTVSEVGNYKIRMNSTTAIEPLPLGAVPLFALRVSWQSPNYDPSLVERRYVRKTCGGLFYCLTNKQGYDIQQGEANPAFVPDKTEKQAALLTGRAFSFVEWPVSLKEQAESLRASLARANVLLSDSRL